MNFNTLRFMKALVIVVLLVAVSTSAQSTAPKPKLGRKPVEAYRVIGNIYYVGATDVSSHIIVTSQGLILLDTGTLEMLPIIRANLEKLGHCPSDIKIILASHAHWDHVEGHAAMQELTKAQVIGMGEDAAALASGIDISAVGFLGRGWKPVKVDRVLKDGDTVTLGNVTLQAHLTPGHTKGCTTWTTTVTENGKSYLVIFLGSVGINKGVTLLGNTRHPAIAEDYAKSFRLLKGLKPDVFLAGHPSAYGMAKKLKLLQAGSAANPFIDPDGYRRAVNGAEARYLKQLAAEKSAQQRR